MIDSTTLTERAWAAGFQDGEGCSYIHSNKDKNGIIRKYPHIQINQVDNALEVLGRFKKAVGGLGWITGPHARNKTGLANCRPYYALNIRSFGPFQTALAHIWPFLSSAKKVQARNVLEECTKNHRDNPPLRAARVNRLQPTEKYVELNKLAALPLVWGLQ